MRSAARPSQSAGMPAAAGRLSSARNDAGVDRKQSWKLTSEPLQSVDEPCEPGRIVHMRSPMAREHRVGLVPLETELRVDPRGLPARAKDLEGIDHDVAEEMHAAGIDA